MMRGILFDMDGVLYEGDTAIPGAAEVIVWCREQNIPFLFLSNTTSRPRRALVEKLAGMGIDIELNNILTPPVAAVNWLKRHRSGPAALFVPESTREEFAAISEARAGEETVSAVVLGDLGEQWDFVTYNRAFRLLMQNPDARLIALGLTRYWQAADGLRLDVGPFVKGLEYATGVESLVMGKPAPPFFQTALDMLGLEAGETLMLGDDIRGDIDGAQRAGINGVLVRSGKFRDHDLSLGITPYAVVDSIAALPDWWCNQGYEQ
ncbi:MAG: TIGR01458 family HAD-type hydrolase [Gammaproteobacteria bacterium]|nr:TIGR01458 family HAD-type hydrolase [Gammaproteobacteria bacterium]